MNKPGQLCFLQEYTTLGYEIHTEAKPSSKIHVLPYQGHLLPQELSSTKHKYGWSGCGKWDVDDGQNYIR